MVCFGLIGLSIAILYIALLVLISYFNMPTVFTAVVNVLFLWSMSSLIYLRFKKRDVNAGVRKNMLIFSIILPVIALLLVLFKSIITVNMIYIICFVVFTAGGILFYRLIKNSQ